MNYNILTYCFYFAITLFVVLYVGGVLFKNGRPFLVNTFAGNESTADAVNKVLLAGYYLLNIGYVAIALKIWIKVDSWLAMVNILSFKTGTIILTLGIMHLFNILILIAVGKNAKKKHLTN